MMGQVRQCLTVGMMACAIGLFGVVRAYGLHPNIPTPDPNEDLNIEGAQGIHGIGNAIITLSQSVVGTAGANVPTAAGGLNGAPVLGYVFPTTLTPEDVGFNGVLGIVAMALTSHPDFDDTPLYDENGDGDFLNDGALYHPHWVVLIPDATVPGELSVAPFDDTDMMQSVPDTHPGLPIFIDSPNYLVEQDGSSITVHVPVAGVNGLTTFNFDAVTAYMEVQTGGGSLLGVYHVYDIFSGDLSLPQQVFSVPEPITATLSLMSLGVLGMATRRRMA